MSHSPPASRRDPARRHCRGLAVARLDYYSAADGGGLNLHQSQSNFGTCFGLAAGSHEVQVWVGPTPGFTGSDCYTGWSSQYHALEVEEVY